MELYLKELHLWYVISTLTPSSVPAEWTTKDNTAHMEIILHCGDRQVQMVRSLKSAEAIWSFFQKTYEHTDLVYQVSLIKRLMNSSMQEGQSATKFVDTWQALLDEVIWPSLRHYKLCFCWQPFHLLGGRLSPQKLQVWISSSCNPFGGQNPSRRGSPHSIYRSSTSGSCYHYQAS